MAPDIRPSSDLRNHYADIARACRDNRQPTILTVNGHGDTVLLGLEDYNQMCAELELLRELAISERDVEEGRVAPLNSTLAELRSSLEHADATMRTEAAAL